MAVCSCLVYFLFIFLPFISENIKLCAATDREMTINIDARSEECFYQTVNQGQTLDIEYQVIDGGQGQMDINFHLLSPQGVELIREFRKADNAHRYTAQETGDFKFCWDNTISHFNSKTVYFEVQVENEEEESNEMWDGGFEGITPEEIYDMKIQDVQDAMNRVRQHLNKVRHIQDNLRAFEARDRNIAESNYVRVNLWSFIQIALMISVGMVQVIMVRSLFDDKSRLHTLWKKKSYYS